MKKADSEATDDDVKLKPDDSALIVSASGEISLFIPHYDDEEEIPPLVAALGMLAVKLQDEGFVAELLAELEDDEDD